MRRDFEDDMKTFTTALVISGATLRNALRNVFQGAGGFALTENESTEVHIIISSMINSKQSLEKKMAYMMMAGSSKIPVLGSARTENSRKALQQCP